MTFRCFAFRTPPNRNRTRRTTGRWKMTSTKTTPKTLWQHFRYFASVSLCNYTRTYFILKSINEMPFFASCRKRFPVARPNQPQKRCRSKSLIVFRVSRKRKTIFNFHHKICTFFWCDPDGHNSFTFKFADTPGWHPNGIWTIMNETLRLRGRDTKIVNVEFLNTFKINNDNIIIRLYLITNIVAIWSITNVYEIFHKTLLDKLMSIRYRLF